MVIYWHYFPWYIIFKDIVWKWMEILYFLAHMTAGDSGWEVELDIDSFGHHSSDLPQVNILQWQGKEKGLIIWIISH